jgi:hypothetical protein
MPRRIARVVLREPALSAVSIGTHEDLKLLSDHRDRLIRARTAELSRAAAGSTARGIGLVHVGRQAGF